ncbi:transposable element Tcb2 transposase [Trichonephila clavipes]|nr:transposable element Tcb2 transposase [Trichonephila clavipes]
MVWEGITLDSRSAVTAGRYRDELLELYVRPFRGVVGLDSLLMDGIARLHRAHLVDKFLESEDISQMDWPTRSPDLSPIEKALNTLGRAIATRKPL